ncbi:unnamed protein product [Pieris macdunnoughi]|uniref:Uncharacterized protein n=1 Tax=Pieris macdunnoughi TaxID=345717 RepID=A0A821WUF6_9NEOP|nr:unnamed protein product [Pieris macdunnoughi]
MTAVATNIVNGILGDAIPNYLLSVIHNHLKLIAANSTHIDINNVVEETAVEKAINNKIDELKSYLQDEYIVNATDKIFQDQTKIVESISKDKHGLREKENQSKHNAKYIRLRKKIDKALKKELISDKAYDLVIKTLDNLIAKLVGSQCNSKNKGTRIRTPKILNDLWNEEWKRLKNNYLQKIKVNDKEQIRELKSFFDGLYTFFSFIIKDMGFLSNRHKIKCEYMDKPIYREHGDFECDSDSENHNNDCKRFVICSKELKNFMLDFYNFINDTTVSVIRNYAEMYIRDTDNFAEKPTIVSSINTTSIKMEKAIVDIFIKNTKAIKLDSKQSKEGNIKSLSNYVRATISEIKNNANNYLGNELKGTKAKLSSGIKDDLNISLKVDLENLQREVLGRICFAFRFCNGKYKGRRNGDVDNSNIEIESEIKELFNLTNYRRLFDIKSDKNSFRSKNYTYATMNVTRTTLFRVPI